MKEKITLTKFLASTLVGATLATSCAPISESRQTSINESNRITCSSPDFYLTEAPGPGESNQKTQSIDFPFVRVNETLSWNPENGRWLIETRSFEELKSRGIYYRLVDKFDGEEPRDKVKEMEEFFSPPQNENDFIRKKTDSYLDNIYTYCWDGKNWQEVSKEAASIPTR